MTRGLDFRTIECGEAIPRLAPGCLHIWRVKTASGDDLRACGDVLSFEENARAAQYYWERDRRAFMRCRAALRRLIGLYARVDAAGVCIELGSHGKPFFSCAQTAGLRFNVSHSGEYALLAFAIDCELGVDVELMRENIDFLGLAAAVLSESERARLGACCPAARANLFYEFWTCKEACIKADGRGLSIPLEYFSIGSSEQSSPWRGIATHVAGNLLHGIQIRILDVADGYAAAVAANASFSEIEQMDYPGFHRFSGIPDATRKFHAERELDSPPFSASRLKLNLQDAPGPNQHV